MNLPTSPTLSQKQKDSEMIKFITVLMIILSFNSFALDISSENEFRLRPRERVMPKNLEFDEEKAKKDSVANDEEAQAESDRSPSSFEKKRQEAVHWKIQQIIDRKDRF